MAEDQRVYLDDIYASKECQGSIFRAVVMMAKEAREINVRSKKGSIVLTKKPTTIAMDEFKQGNLTLAENKGGDIYEENTAANEQNSQEMTSANASAISAAADDAFG